MGHMSHDHSGKRASKQALVLGSGTAGFLEILIFHPVDTVAKRLMSNQKPLMLPGQGLMGSLPNINSVIFRDAANKGFFSKWGSLFPGLGFATLYKISQRVYKFGGQPVVASLLSTGAISDSVGRLVGERWKQPITGALAGSMIGIGEVLLLPLDVLKIKRQTNPQAFVGRSLWDIIRQENFGLYRGGLWTAARNAPGSFALFGGSSLTKELLGIKDQSKSTFGQNLIASTVGATCSILVSQPIDLIKTRIQNKNFGEKVSGLRVVGDLIKNEGPGAFFKGVVPKIAVVSPKLIFSFAAAQSLITFFDGFLASPTSTNAPATPKKL